MVYGRVAIKKQFHLGKLILSVYPVRGYCLIKIKDIQNSIKTELSWLKEVESF